MQQDYTIAREKNAMFGSVILKVYFDAFSSKGAEIIVDYVHCKKSTFVID